MQPQWIDFGAMRSFELADGVSAKPLFGKGAMLNLVELEPGAVVPLHSHPHEQIFWMLKGRMDFRLGDERRSCGPGDVGVIPGGVEHEAWFPEDTEVIDVFAPRREEFLTGEIPAYMRKG